MTADEIKALIADAIIAHEGTLTLAGRLVSAAATGGPPPIAPVPTVSCKFVTDPYKGNFNPAERRGAALFNKATDPLKDTDTFTFNQDKAVNLLAEMKTQSEKFKWGKQVNSVQVILKELSTSIDTANLQSLLIKPNMIPLDSV